MSERHYYASASTSSHTDDTDTDDCSTAPWKVPLFSKTIFNYFPASTSSHTDDTDTEQNGAVVGTFREPTPPPPPPPNLILTAMQNANVDNQK
ncbi:hypothetical protein QE152_g38458 [Popillia japonica]|uniref:Uncharacterized protein n=1 Tax=Popillia japonica TaxID=7064 RepID=A0AAW1HYF8_POPJA